MALQMAYTYKGQLYPESYWRVGYIEPIDWRCKKANVQFWCYPSEAARDGSIENFLPGATKPYTLEGQDFSNIFESIVDMRAALYAYAKAKKEGEEPEEGEEDTRVSFFENAVDI